MARKDRIRKAVKRPTSRTSYTSIALAYGDLLEYEYETLLALEEFIQDLMEDLAMFGAERMRQILEDATTPTGEARAAAGGNGPGRVDTGKMRDAIAFGIQDRGEESYVGEWGWLNTVLEYWLYQEYGDAGFNVRFEGMKALQQSYIEARELMLERLQSAGIQVSR